MQDPSWPSLDMRQHPIPSVIREPLHLLGWRELLTLSQEICARQNWFTVREFALSLFRWPRYVVLAHALHAGRPVSVAGMTAYTVEMKPLPYDFSRPFWQRPCSAESDAPTILQRLDMLISEKGGAADLSTEARERFRQEQAADFLETNAHVFSDLPVDPARTKFDLAYPPMLSFPFIFVPQSMTQTIQSSADERKENREQGAATTLTKTTEAHIQQQEIPKALIQRLIDAAYKLAVATHYEDVPEDGVEQPVIAVLRQFKQLGFEPTEYSSDGDPDLLLSRPRWVSESSKQRRERT